MRKTIRLLLSFVIFAGLTFAAEQKVPPAPQEVFAPYWTAEPGWHTDFQLRNGLHSAPLVVTPVLRLADGREYALTPVTILGSDVVTVDVQQELAKLAPQILDQPGSYGSAILQFTSPHYKNLYAAVMVHEMGQPIGYHIDAFAPESQYNVGSREGIWWLPRPGTKDNLIIANGSDKPNHGELSLYDSTGKAWKQDVQLAPRQTVRFSVAELVNKAGLSGTYGGIRFDVAERAGYIDTVHFLYDETAGFSALMKMFDHDPSAKLEERVWGGNTVWTVRAPMLALQEPDPALALPAGTTLQPKIFIRNTTSRPLVATVKLTWRGESKRGVLKLPPLQLRPFETHLIDVAALQQAKQLPGDTHWALVEISSAGKPDELMAIASSYDSTGRYGVQTPFSDQLADQWIGGEWQVDASHNTIIAVTNAGSKPTDAVLTFHYNHGEDRYEIRRTITAGDQLWLNLGDIIHGSIPDSQGRKFPAELTGGSYDLREPDGAGNPSLFEGKIIVDKTYGHLAYGCLECCAYTSVMMLPNPEQLAVQGQDLLSVQAYQSCSDDWMPVTGLFSGWDTGNHSVAMMASNQITGMGAGSTNALASGSLLGSGPPRHCPMQMRNPATPANVHVPTSLKVVNTSILQTGNSGNHGCLSGYYGIEVDVDYQVLDQNNQPIQSAAMTPQEYIVWYNGTNNGGFTNIGPTYISTTSLTTRADGTFDDAPVGLCNSVPFNTPLTSTQTIQVLLNGKAYTVRTNNWQFSSTNLPNHGTVTNGSDINATQ